jgi:hypothetical protein
VVYATLIWSNRDCEAAVSDEMTVAFRGRHVAWHAADARVVLFGHGCESLLQQEWYRTGHG